MAADKNGRNRGRTAPSTSMPLPDCVFCRRLRIRAGLDRWTVYEDEVFLAAHQVTETGPDPLGIVLVQTKRHVPDLASLTDAEAARLGLVLARVSRALTACTAAAWTYCFGFMEAYRHVHVVIASRHPDLPAEYVRLRFHEWPQGPHGGRAEVADLCRRLRAAIPRPPAL